MTSEQADRDFPFVLNRSCYIPINRWQNQPQLRDAIPELVSLFETTIADDSSSAATQHLRALVRDFTQTEQYRVLRDIAREIEQKSHRRFHCETKPLGSLIRRYPYLYEHRWLDRNAPGEQMQQIRSMRERKQQQFDLDLSQYVLTRRSRGRERVREHLTRNPTLLSDSQLNFAIDHFTSKIDGVNTYRDLARQFRSYTRQTRSYRTFKDELYEYLMTSVDRINPKYARGQFNQRLYQHLQNTLPQNDRQKLNEDLWHKTCRKLLDFLVVEHSRQPDHYVFLDLSANLGSAPTIGILLKIVLCCDRVKSYLEQRFAILFDRYEDAAKNSITWLVDSLENLNVAFSLHFRHSHSSLSF
ncbi:hypothetical protein IQ235_06305 [Oscillatoriales cyanobacterium LEGE 11467]|uniref:Uncharacterized protein n=1 Tax=Zarconia navalis LEGE 11467 TaxID=1828826 RepID=A0A928VZ85_9CYAN|nr:hypothetical protein [Zarconia navalis]MBE9040400.1 hypothetical protein [Zarconia navalis LEGE 11467]